MTSGMSCKAWLLIFPLLFILGCQTAQPGPKSNNTDTISALTKVTQGLTNKPVTEADLKNLAQQAATDPQARSALQEINSALGAQHRVKYCPVDGQRFSAEVVDCPVHHVKLKWVE